MGSITDKSREEILVESEITKAQRAAGKRTLSKYDRSAQAELAKQRAQDLPGQRRAVKEQRKR